MCRRISRACKSARNTALGGVPGSVANGSNFSAAFRYDYKAFAVAAGYVKLKDMATSSGARHFAINSPVNSGYASARSTQLFATAARYTFDDLMVGHQLFERAVRAGRRFAFHERSSVQYLRRDLDVSIHAGGDRRRGVQLHAGQQVERYQRCGTLSPAIARRDLQSVEAHDALCLAGVSARAGKTLVASGVATSIVDAVAVVGDRRTRRRRPGRRSSSAWWGFGTRFNQA